MAWYRLAFRATNVLEPYRLLSLGESLFAGVYIVWTWLCTPEASYFVADMSECVKQNPLRGLATLAQGRTQLNMAGGEKEEAHDFGATSYLELLRGLATCAEFIALRYSLWLLGRCHVLIGTRCSLMFYEKKYAKKT